MLVHTPAAILRRRATALLVAIALAASMAVAGVAPTAAEDDAATGSVVVTTEVLGSIVGQLVGQAGEVVVLMEGGANPHTFEPSARDAERILKAGVVVSNGLDLEEGLVSLLESAEAEGVAWFEAADHVVLRGLDDADEGVADDHGQGTEDPHIWTDPLLMRDVVAALEPVLTEAGIDTAGNAAALMADLEALDAEVAETLAMVAPEARKLVTGHRSMAYFAERYGFEQIGTVIPGLSTSGEPSARELAQLIDDIREHDVPAVFAEVGTPQSVAQAVTSDSGAELVSLSTSQLPEDGTYQSFIRDMAMTVAVALGA